MAFDLTKRVQPAFSRITVSGWRAAIVLNGELRWASAPPDGAPEPGSPEASSRSNTENHDTAGRRTPREDAGSYRHQRETGPARSALPIDLGTAPHASRPGVLDQDREFRFVFPETDIVWTLTVAPCSDALTVHSRIHNAGTQPVALGEACPLYQAHVGFGAPGDQIAVLPYQAWGEQRVYDLRDPELPARGKVMTQCWNRSRGVAVQAAFLTFEDVDTNVALSPAGPGAEATLTACCDFDGWCLPAGESVDTETFRLQQGTNPYTQLEAWAVQAAERIKPRIWAGNPHGWLGGSWVDAVNGSEPYEKVALENLEAINRRLPGLGLRYLWTSMKNFAGSQPGNWLEWNRRCIPMGREAFLAAVRQRGFLPGFWIGPYYISSALQDLVEELAAADALLRDREGNLLVVCPEWRHGDSGRLPREQRPELYSLDPTHPRALEFLRKVFSTYRDWGVRYYMVDFLEAAAGKLGRFPYDHTYDDSLIPGPQAYRHSLRVIKGVAGEDTFLLSSTGPKIHSAGMVDGVRVGNDLGEGRAITPDAFFFPASYVINKLSFWTSAAYALNCMAAYYPTHRRLFVNNAGNVLTVGKPMPLNEAQVMATVHALSGGPSMLGDDIRRLSQQRLELIARTLPRSIQAARPLDLFDALSPDGPRRFVRRVKTSWGTYTVLALFNLDTRPQEMIVEPEPLGHDPATTFLVWEFWQEKYLGMHRGQLSVHVPEESVRVLRLTEARHEPVLLGTDMHVMMGEEEIPAFAYDPASMTCTFTARRPPGSTGMVVIHAPEGLRVDGIDGLHIAKDGRDGSLIIGTPVTFGNAGEMRRTIRFAPVDIAPST